MISRSEKKYEIEKDEIMVLTDYVGEAQRQAITGMKYSQEKDKREKA
jgi:hypothetical protein